MAVLTSTGDVAGDDEIEDLTIVTHNQGSVSLLVDDDNDITAAISSITFTEDGNNETQFINDELRTTDDAPRGLSFSIGYDNTVSPAISFGTAGITIDAGSEWSSGEEIGVTLTDPDANTNTEAADDLSVTTTYDRIPTIKVGEPFTLAHEGIEVVQADDAANTYKFEATPTEISDILVIDFRDVTATDADGAEVDDPTAPAIADGTVIDIDLGTTNILTDYLPNDHTDFIGTHMLNYDVSALENVRSIELIIGDGDDE